jgi:two-component system OmpR family sensor kinase
MITTKRSRRRSNGELAMATSEVVVDSDPPSSGPLKSAAPGAAHEGPLREGFSDAEISAYLRTDFLSRIAHDLRSPLGVTSGAIQELETRLGPDLAKEHADLFGMAQRSLKKLARMADRLNMIAQLERATLEIVRSPTDLVDVARTAIKHALAVDARSAVTVRSELPDTPCLVLGDPRWLVPAIAEMVGNAVRHAHRNACVRIEVDRGDVCLVVEDDGGGITPSARELMFQRLVPRGNDRSLGLGLSIVHDVLAAHGGTLEIDATVLLPGGPRTSITRFIARLARHDMASPGAR